jgi:hypothetical protein
MLDEELPASRRVTPADDRGYDRRDFFASRRALKVTPHIAQNQAHPGGSVLDGRTVRHPGYAISRWTRKRVEEAFDWMKTVGGAPHPLQRPCAGADECLPGSRRVQPHQNRQAQTGSRINRRSIQLLHPARPLKTGHARAEPAAAINQNL